MRVSTHDELLALLDDVVASAGRGDRSARTASTYWSTLIGTPGHPLATDLPDECLLDWSARGLLGDLDGARVLDVGCGNGRNARWFAQQGAVVTGLDIATGLLEAARPTMPPSVRLLDVDVLREDLPSGPFDVIHDSGCYHHLAPHRRPTYRERIPPLLAPNGRFGIVAFSAESLPQPDDTEILRTGDLAGGMSFTLEDLRHAFAGLTPLDLRPARPATEDAFGSDLLGVALFARERTEPPDAAA